MPRKKSVYYFEIGGEMRDDDIMAQAEELCNREFPEYANKRIVVTPAPGDREAFLHILNVQKELADTLPQLLSEAKTWKAKAIEERAMQKSRFCNDNLDEMRDFWMHDMDDSSKNEMIELAACELEEEMRNV